MSFTRAEIVEMIDEYKKAEQRVLLNKSYTINGRSMTKVDLVQIREGRQDWEQRLAEYDVRLKGGSSLYAVSDFSS